MRALISVYDRTGVVKLARTLHQAGVELISTGGTGGVIREAGLPVTQVSDLTGFPEILDGRVKTLHPIIYGGLLAKRDDPEHVAQLAKQDIDFIDMVVVNLYPFVQTVSKPNVSLEEALENIDIGGPSMLRAASKNFPFVIPLVDPADYGWVGGKVQGDGLSHEERRRLAAKAFSHVAAYDSAVTQYLAGTPQESLPPAYGLALEKLNDLRYGENPHQRAALYSTSLGIGGVAHARQLHGPELSFINLLDADAAWQAATDFSDSTVAVIKHATPCGLASHPDLADAYRRALAGDPVSAYGGIIGCNRIVTAAMAREMKGTLYHVIVAPGYEPEALELLINRRSLRVLAVDPSPASIESYTVRSISGGLLLQTWDTLAEDPSSWKVVTARKPTPEEMEGLAFAWKAVKHVKSNAIVLAQGKTLVGMGAGQPNRVTSARIAVQVAGERAAGSVMASDAYLPFADNVEAAADAGVTAIVQPGGSMRDQECIGAADRLGIAMVFTGVRHFRH